MSHLIDALCRDHANFAKLLRLIEQHSEIAERGDALDADVLAAAVEYLISYPTLFHHPLEDAICDLLQRLSARAVDVAAIVAREHCEIRIRVRNIARLVDELKNGGGDPGRFAVAARTFASGEWEHMARERDELFPLALSTFSDNEWDLIEKQVPRIEDPLFNVSTSASLKCLHLALLECETSAETAHVLGARERRI